MNKQTIYKRLLTVATTLFFLGAFFTRCASVGTPTGGPMDTIPPTVLGMMPELFSTNFQDDKVYITFNEYVQIKNQQKELYT